jgi:hypothetical protein
LLEFSGQQEGAMRDTDAMLRTTPTPTFPARSIPTKRAVTYEQFQQMLSIASREIQESEHHRRGVVPIPRLRRALAHVPFASFNQHLLRMERNGVVYLIPPGDPDVLSDDARRDSLIHPRGDLRSFLIWISPRARTSSSLWD